MVQLGSSKTSARATPSKLQSSSTYQAGPRQKQHATSNTRIPAIMASANNAANNPSIVMCSPRTPCSPLFSPGDMLMSPRLVSPTSQRESPKLATASQSPNQVSPRTSLGHVSARQSPRHASPQQGPSLVSPRQTLPSIKQLSRRISGPGPVTLQSATARGKMSFQKAAVIVKHMVRNVQKFASTSTPASKESDQERTDVEGKELVAQYTETDLSKLAPHVRVIVDRISKHLRFRTKLKDVVVKFFKQAVVERSASAVDASLCQAKSVDDMSLDMCGLMKFVELFCIGMDLPPYAFGSIEDAFCQFDFNGAGSLHVNEVYKMVKCFLEHYREELGGAPRSVEIPWQSPTEVGYEIIKELGRGNQGTAKLARSKNGDEICMKVFRKERMNERRVEELVSEFNAMNMLSCERIAGTRALFQDNAFFYMACDLYRGGDFHTLTVRAQGQGISMTLDWWRKIFRQCVEGLAFMHEQAIMHCDIKESNIMLKSNDFREPQIVIIDLGVCTSLAKVDDWTPSGTPGYVPPETLTDLRWYPRGDIFSLGVTIFQVLCEMRPPTSGIFLDECSTARDIFKATMEREPSWGRFPDSMPGLREIVVNMLAKDRKKRPRAPQVLMDEWFAVSDVEQVHLSSPPGLARHREDLYANVRPHNDLASIGITVDMVADLDKK